jgi:glutathione synthase
VAKPPAGSLGRDVFVLKPGGPNNRAILQNLCGREEDQYTLLQQYVSEVTSGEKRVLFAGGKVIGQYRRTATGDHRTNLIQGATSTACDLSEAEAIYCRTIGQVLTSMGAGFVGIDLIYPWVIEFNVINPGGITTIDELTGVDLTNAVLDSLEI